MNLANKYRPKSFKDVIGQDITITILENLIEKGKLQHSMLFVGPAGSGKTTCARILANNIDGEVFEIDSASNNGVADIKSILQRSKVFSITHSFKVFILDEAHTITSAAWSAFLIALEEQNTNAFFIFCTTNAEKIPDTILSRLQIFTFKPINELLLFERLQYITKQERIDITEEALQFIAKRSNGNVRQALAHIDKCLLYSNKIDLDVVLKVLNLLSKQVIEKLMNEPDKIKVCKYIKEIQSRGYDLYTMLQLMLEYCLEEKRINDLEFILDIMKEVKYMTNNPGNLCNFICAKVLVR